MFRISENIKLPFTFKWYCGRGVCAHLCGPDTLSAHWVDTSHWRVLFVETALLDTLLLSLVIQPAVCHSAAIPQGSSTVSQGLFSHDKAGICSVHQSWGRAGALCSTEDRLCLLAWPARGSGAVCSLEVERALKDRSKKQLSAAQAGSAEKQHRIWYLIIFVDLMLIAIWDHPWNDTL